MNVYIKKIIALCVGFFICLFSFAEDSSSFNPDLDYAQVVYVRVVKGINNLWTFHVSVRHDDKGWDHYADLWEVVNPETGEVLGQRVLAHPHDAEQPFMRSLNNIEIPQSILAVIVRAKCNLHGFEGKQVFVDFTITETNDYIIEY